MGTDCEVLVVDGHAGIGRRAQARVQELERKWSRFLPDSDVSRVNAASGRPVIVSASTLVLFEHALAAARATDGLVDPTVGRALVAHGYDRDFAAVRVAARSVAPVPHVDGSWPAIEVDHHHRTVTLPRGSRFDPGAIGKGLAADLISAELVPDAGGILVNLGGDLRVRGTAPTADGWVVTVDDPFGPDELVRLSITSGAVATSSRLRRCWTTAAGAAHHVIDPRTGRPAATGVAAVTVVAADAWWAEAQATALFLQGPTGLDRLDGRAEAVIVTDEGAVHATAALMGAFR
jgi:thiamine biosynthesis lipoprotein